MTYSNFSISTGKTLKHLSDTEKHGPMFWQPEKNKNTEQISVP